MNAQTLYINRDTPSVLICPSCGKSKAVDGSSLLNKRGQTLLVACRCGTRFPVFIESRRSFRREKSCRGQVAKLPLGNEWHSMLLTSVSLFGLGFSSPVAARLRAGDDIRVRFPLDEKGHHQMEGNVEVVWARESSAGCQFKEDIQNDNFRAFYLML